MKPFVIVVISIILFIIILLSTVILLKIPISQGKFFKQARVWVQIFCPPKDLFDFILSEKVDMESVGVVQKFNFKIKYIGPYTGGILLDKFTEDLYRMKHDLKLKIKIDFYVDDNLIATRETSSDYSPFRGYRGNGLMLFTFECPKDIPINTEITYNVLILETDDYLNEQCGPMRLYIQKASEM